MAWWPELSAEFDRIYKSEKWKSVTIVVVMHPRDPSPSHAKELREGLQEWCPEPKNQPVLIVPHCNAKDVNYCIATAYRTLKEFLGHDPASSDVVTDAVLYDSETGNPQYGRIFFFSSQVPPEKIAECENKQKACFVATVVYGDYNDERVVALRNFRDKRLSQHPFGRIAIRVYYMIGPYLAFVMRRISVAKSLAQLFLDWLVRRLRK